MGFRIVKRVAFAPCARCKQGGVTVDMDDERGRDSLCLLCGARFSPVRSETMEEHKAELLAVRRVMRV